jgi:hypothetical protein
VRFEVSEPRLGRMDIAGAGRFDAANIRRSIPSLREGRTPDSRQIARNLLLDNENPARQSTVLMRGGETDAIVDATIKIIEDKVWKASVSLDNTGTSPRRITCPPSRYTDWVIAFPFTNGDPRSLPEFQQLFPDEAACSAYVERARWRAGFV